MLLSGSLLVGEFISRPCEDGPGAGPNTCVGRPPGNMDISLISGKVGPDTRKSFYGP